MASRLKIGAALRQARRSLKLSQATAGARAVPSLSQAKVSRLEKGSDAPMSSYEALAGAVGLEIMVVPIGRAVTPTTYAGQPVPDLIDEFGVRDDE
jgi:hypothetical protein